MVTDEELRKKAEKRAEEKVDFLIHFTMYVCVNALLVGIWFFTGGSGWFSGGERVFPWFIFPLFGWGIGLVAHFFGAFASPKLTDRFVEKEYERLKRK
jgi:fatty acid desaturase